MSRDGLLLFLNLSFCVACINPLLSVLYTTKVFSKFKNFILITHKHLRLECALQLSSVGLNHFEWVIKCLCLIVFLFCFCVCLFSIKNGRISRNNSTICGMCVYFPHAELKLVVYYAMPTKPDFTELRQKRLYCIFYRLRKSESSIVG